jgi:hypothetical protein
VKKIIVSLSLIFTFSNNVETHASSHVCKVVNAGSYEEGFYSSKTTSGSVKLKKIDPDNAIIPNRKQEIVFVSDKGREKNGLIIFQVSQKEVLKAPKKLKTGQNVNILRDEVDFLCDGNKDNSPLALSQTSLTVSEEEYDRYHRFFYVNKKKVGEQLYQLFHFNYLKNDKSCVRTDHVSRRFLFLLNKRMNNYGRVAGLLDRLPFRTSKAIASSDKSQLNQVFMKKYSRKEGSNGCAVLNLKPYGKFVKIEATDIEDSFFKRNLLKNGNFHKIELTIK